MFSYKCCKIHRKLTCVEVSDKFRSEGYNFTTKENLIQLLSCEFCKNFKKTFFHRTAPGAAFGDHGTENEKNINSFMTEAVII